MPTTIIDLDEILGDDKQVRLQGEIYTLPPDLPAELYLKINRFAQEERSDSDMAEVLYEEVLRLFQYKQPGLKSLPISLSQLVVAIARIYGSDDSEDDAAPPPVTRGGASTKKTGTRSRRSTS